MRESDDDLLIGAHSESRAVEDVGPGATPDVGLADLRVRVRDDGCDVGRDHVADADSSAAPGQVASVDRLHAGRELAGGLRANWSGIGGW